MKLKNTIPCCFLVVALFLSSPVQSQTDQLDLLLQQYHRLHLFSGNALVVVKGNVLLEKSYGLAHREWNIAHQPTTKFRIGSLTKQFTALLILQLKQEGKLELQQPITRYLPWYPKETGEKITIHHLLTHSSGLVNYTENAEAINDIITHSYSPEEIARKYCVSSLTFEPGSTFGYCNTGYYLLGLVIETLTGKSFAEALREKILLPAGMNDTGMDRPEAILPQRAEGYGYSFEGYTHAPYIDPFSVNIFSTASASFSRPWFCRYSPKLCKKRSAPDKAYSVFFAFIVR